MEKKLILCLLANEWGRKGHDNILVFRVNPLNKSDKVMLETTKGHDMWFGNVEAER